MPAVLDIELAGIAVWLGSRLAYLLYLV
jgi:hypothetical protein